MQYSNAMKINTRPLKCNYYFVMRPHVHSTSRELVVWAQRNILEPCVLDITKGNYLITAGLNESKSLNSRKSLLTFGDSRSIVWPSLLSYTINYWVGNSIYICSLSPWKYLQAFIYYSLNMLSLLPTSHRITEGFFSVNKHSVLLIMHLFAFSVRS